MIAPFKLNHSMTKTYSQLQAQIAKLHERAEAIKAKEIDGVIDRIKTAIEHYSLTPTDLFGPHAGKAAKVKPKTQSLAKKRRKQSAAQPRYRDDAGNTWTGHGRRPRWFVAALEGGKVAKDLETIAEVAASP